MITGAEGRQTHTLLDLKKQQWAKERGKCCLINNLCYIYSTLKYILHLKYKLLDNVIFQFYSYLNYFSTVVEF